MVRSLNTLLLVCLLAIIATGQRDLSKPVPLDPSIRVGKLPNGLTYYIKKNAKPENKVELRLVVNAGSVLERDDQQGVAHFVEHMAFNGTKSFRKNELISSLQSMGVRFGADLNALTSFDETVYILPIPTDKSEYLDTGLQILSEWASGITLEPSEIERERGVILEELRLGSGAERRMLDRYFPMVFPMSKYADRFAIGKPQIIESVRAQTLVDFYEDWYRPDLMAVVAVGNLDVAETEKIIAGKFSSIKPKRQPIPRPEFQVPDHRKTLVAIATDKEAQGTIVQVLFKKPVSSVITKSDYRRELVRLVFNRMFDMRLKGYMVSEDPRFMLVGSDFTPFLRNKSVYAMVGIVEPRNVRPALSILFEESRRVKEFGFDEYELRSAKDIQLNLLETRFKDREKIESSDVANRLVSHFLSRKPIAGEDFDKEFSKRAIATITLAEINAAARAMLADTNRAIIVSGKESDGVKFPTEGEIANLLRSSETKKLDRKNKDLRFAADDELGGASGDLKAEKKGDKNTNTNAKIVDEKTDGVFGVTYLTLSNGVKAALRPDLKADRITMKAFSPGGLSLVGGAKFSREFVAAIDGKGGLNSQADFWSANAAGPTRVSLGIDDSYEYVMASAPSDDVRSMLAQVTRKFTDNRVDKSTFDAYKRILKALDTESSANPMMFFEQQVNQLTNQVSASAQWIPGGELDKISLDDVNAIYKERFGDASDFTFVFTGNFEISSMRQLLLENLGTLPTANSVEKTRDLGIRPPDGKVEKVFRKGIGRESYVRLMFTGEANYDETDDRLLGFLDDLMQIRLLEVLREERSMVYTLNAKGRMVRTPYGRFEFSVEFPCGPENVGALIEATLRIIEKIQEGEIAETDLNKVKILLVRNAREDASRDDYWAAAIMQSLRDGTPLRSQAEIEKRINIVAKDDLVRVARKYLIADQRKQFVLMPEK